jgi:hypothetical protein
MQNALADAPVENFPNVVPLEKIALTKQVHVDTPDSAPTEGSEEGSGHGQPTPQPAPQPALVPQPQPPAAPPDPPTANTETSPNPQGQ